MKVKMLENFQEVGTVALHSESGVNVSFLEKDEIYVVSNALGAWLVENRKAVEIDKEPVHYGGQKEPELRHDDEKYEQMKAEADAEPIESPEPELDMMTTENQPTRKKRTRK